MRESIGGGWLFGIVIVFIFMFSGFLAYSISYTKAFNVKNEVVNYIEHNEGFTTYDGDFSVENESDPSILNKSVEGKIYNLIYNAGYDFEGNGTVKCSDNGVNYYGVCISKFCPIGQPNEVNHKMSQVHYKVTTYINFQIPFLGLKFTIPITGETRSIYQDKGGYACNDEVFGGSEIIGD